MPIQAKKIHFKVTRYFTYHSMATIYKAVHIGLYNPQNLGSWKVYSSFYPPHWWYWWNIWSCVNWQDQISCRRFMKPFKTVIGTLFGVFTKMRPRLICQSHPKVNTDKHWLMPLRQHAWQHLSCFWRWSMRSRHFKINSYFS